MQEHYISAYISDWNPFVNSQVEKGNARVIKDFFKTYNNV